MLKYLKNKFYSLALGIGFALSRIDDLMFKPIQHDFSEKDKKNQRHRHRNNVLEQFYAGKEDEKYTKEYYEILKKSDEFIKKATPRKMAAVADNHGMSYGHEDKNGEKHEHYGFFDAKHKNKDKTIAEVLEKEYKERRTDDDDYKLVEIIGNSPKIAGMAKVFDFLEETEDAKYVLKDPMVVQKKYEFPIKCLRSIEVVNKIEQLTETLHIKEIGVDLLRLEFFIPMKYKTHLFDVESDIFKEIINFDQVFFTNKYGKLIGYRIENYVKRVTVKNKNGDDAYDVIKFMAKEIIENN
jgi:hypothetical protein